MKKSCLLILIFFINFLTADSTEIAAGILYEHVQQDPNLSIHIVRCNPKKITLEISAAHDKCKSSEKVSEIAQRKNALIAINAGFFDFGKKTKLRDLFAKFLDALGYSNYYAFPVYDLKINNDWFSIYHNETAKLGITKENHLLFDTSTMRWNLIIGGNRFPIAEVNKPYAQGPILYTPAYNDYSEKKKNVTEIIIEAQKIKEIIVGNGGTPIPRNGCMYAIEKKYRKNFDMSTLTVGLPVYIEQQSNNLKFHEDQFKYVIGSTPLLLKNGTITDTVLHGTSTFYTKRHPRTAIGVTEKGIIILVVIDGRQKTSVGLSLLDLAQFMKTLGCSDALNLDGGGSSTMVIKNKVVNRPSGREWGLRKKERPLSNALLIFPKN